MKAILLFIVVSLSAFGQATVPIQVPGESAVSMTLSAEAVSAITAFIKSVTINTPVAVTLDGDITSVATTINVSSSSGITTGMGAVIQSEISIITAINGNALTVSRHAIGTSAAAHTSGTPVTFLRSGSYSVFIANTVSDAVVNSLTATPGPVVSAANAAISTQRAVIVAAQAAAVTHVP